MPSTNSESSPAFYAYRLCGVGNSESLLPPRPPPSQPQPPFPIISLSPFHPFNTLLIPAKMPCSYLVLLPLTALLAGSAQADEKTYCVTYPANADMTSSYNNMMNHYNQYHTLCRQQRCGEHDETSQQYNDWLADHMSLYQKLHDSLLKGQNLQTLPPKYRKRQSSNENSFNTLLAQFNALQQQTMLENLEMQKAQQFWNPLESMTKKDATS